MTNSPEDLDYSDTLYPNLDIYSDICLYKCRNVEGLLHQRVAAELLCEFQVEELFELQHIVEAALQKDFSALPEKEAITAAQKHFFKHASIPPKFKGLIRQVLKRNLWMLYKSVRIVGAPEVVLYATREYPDPLGIVARWRIKNGL